MALINIENIANGLGDELKEFLKSADGELAYLGDPTTGFVDKEPGGGSLSAALSLSDPCYCHRIPDAPQSVFTAQFAADYPFNRRVYGTPVYVKRVDGGRFLVTKPFDVFATEYYDGVPVLVQNSVSPRTVDYLRLQAQIVPSLTTLVSEGVAQANDELWQIAPKQTKDFLSDLPGTAGLARAVLIEVDPSTGSLFYTNGTLYAYDTTTQLPTHESAFNTYYPRAITSGRKALGYVRLHDDQATDGITEEDVYPTQFASGGGGSSGGVDILVYVGL